MRLKKGVKVDGIKTELLIGLMVAESVWLRNNAQLTVTACKDGVHKVGSFHYKGWAADLRTKDLPDMDIKFRMLEELRAALTPDYDVILESVGEANEHMHLEYDPR